MLNNIELAQVYQQELDRSMAIKSTTGYMELNSDLVKYNGGNEIKIASIVMNGLGDYDRAKGFPDGNITLTFETHKMTQDRGRTFMIDSMDVDESYFVATAASIMGLFQDEYVVPEVDSYRYSKIAKLAIANGKVRYGYVPNSKDILDNLLDDITCVQEKIGESVPLVISMSISTANVLNASDKIVKNLDVTDFDKGEVNIRVQTFNGIPIIKVPSDRLKTDYKFYSGIDEESQGGFQATSDAKNINWIITAKRTPIAVSKTERVRIIQPNENPVADAWKLDYRKYHDLWIPKNKLNSIFVNIREMEG